MSTKSSIFLTKDNEHCYTESSEPVFDGEKFLGDTIYLEMSKENLSFIQDDSQDLIVGIRPGCELYELIKSIKQD